MFTRFRSAVLSVAIVMAVALAFVSTPAPAVDLPPELSGTYRGTAALDGWTCELRAFEFYTPPGSQTPGSNRALSAECQTPQGFGWGSISTANACPSTAVTQVPLRFDNGPITPSTPRLAIQSYQPASKRCPLGEVVVKVGTGPPSLMCRTQIVITAPYPGCNAPTTARRR